MPGVIRAAEAIGTLPYSLSTKFTESHSAQFIGNEYHDGSSQRSSLVTSGRRTWKLSKRLTIAQLALLRDFWIAAKGRAFYFYNPTETLPLFSHAPTGTAGRYLVRFASDWEETDGMVRSDTSLELIELASGQDMADASTVTNAAVPGQVTISIITAHIPNGAFTPFPGAEISIEPVSLFIPADWISTSAAWGIRTDVKSTTLQTWSGFVLFALDHFGGGSLTTLSPPDEIRIYDAQALVVYGDGSTKILSPATATASVLGPGNVTNMSNAYDGDLTTYASVTRTSYPTNALPNSLILSNFQ